MKSILSTTLIAAASVSLSVSAAYGQEKLQASIPFEFTVGKRTLPEGIYVVSRAGGNFGRMLQIRSVESRTGILVNPNHPVYANRVPDPKLVFKCANAGCVLTEIWSGDLMGAGFVTPKASSGNGERIAQVALTRMALSGR